MGKRLSVKQDKGQREVHRCECDECGEHARSQAAREHRAINRIMATLNEKNGRRFAGVLVLQLGHGGVEQVRRITGLSRTTIQRGRDEVQSRESKKQASQIRQPGGGRPLAEKNIRAY